MTVSPRIPGDGDRLADLAQDAVLRLGGVLRDWVPPEAQVHLLNAQRELLTALVLIYEHQGGARKPSPPRRRVATRAAAGVRAAPPRLRRIDIDE